MSFGSFEDLNVYKKCRLFRIEISKVVSQHFPDHEKYSLSSQIIRSSRSVTANIAEGAGRYHFQENIQFCRTSRGSLTETLEHLIVAYDEKYIDADTLKRLKQLFEECLKLLNGYILYLKKQKNLK